MAIMLLSPGACENISQEVSRDAKILYINQALTAKYNQI